MTWEIRRHEIAASEIALKINSTVSWSKIYNIETFKGKPFLHIRPNLHPCHYLFVRGKNLFNVFFIFSYLTNVQYLSVGENDLTCLPDEIGMTLELPVDLRMYG